MKFVQLSQLGLFFGSINIFKVCLGQTNGTGEWCELTCLPSKVTDLLEGKSKTINVNYTCSVPGQYNLTLRPRDTRTFAIDWSSHFILRPSSNGNTGRFNFTVRGLRLGRSGVLFSVRGKRQGDSEFTDNLRTVPNYQVLVLREYQVIYDVFLVILALMLVVTNFGFGCRIDLDIVKAVLKKPIQPAIGFVCQFGIMPPLALGIAKMLNLQGVYGLGLLTIGSSSGGGGSNIFTFLFDADISLSITMTLLSTLAALGMTTFWIWALGPQFGEGDGRVRIPAVSVVGSLLVVIIPVIIGIVTRHYHRKVGDLVNRALRPFVFLLALLFVTIGLYVYWYAFAHVTWQIFVAATLLPWIGFVLGGLMAFVCRQDKSRIITIAFETGMQNIQLALFMNRTALGDPEADLANVPVIWYLLMSLFPPFVIAVGREIYKKVKGKREGVDKVEVDIVKDNVKPSIETNDGGYVNGGAIVKDVGGDGNPTSIESDTATKPTTNGLNRNSHMSTEL